VLSVQQHVPLTLGGKAKFMIANVLAATVSCHIYKDSKPKTLAYRCKPLLPSAAQTPGRMNIFDFKKFKVLIDFAHDPAAGSAEWKNT